MARSEISLKMQSASFLLPISSRFNSKTRLAFEDVFSGDFISGKGLLTPPRATGHSLVCVTDLSKAFSAGCDEFIAALSLDIPRLARNCRREWNIERGFSQLSYWLIDGGSWVPSVITREFSPIAVLCPCQGFSAAPLTIEKQFFIKLTWIFRRRKADSCSERNKINWIDLPLNVPLAKIATEAGPTLGLEFTIRFCLFFGQF